MITPEQLLRPKSQESGSTLDRPLEHLTACHRRIEERLGTLERVGAHLDGNSTEPLEAIASCFRFFDSNGVLHTADEEESVFPRLQPRLSDEERTFIGTLEDQHREADRLYSELKAIAVELQSGLPASRELQQRYRTATSRLAELYRSHMAAEDVMLIALGQRVLSAPELAEISQEMKNRRGLSA
jgi:iron-sulfur cluster repair protein YtfE (RIC family)